MYLRLFAMNSFRRSAYSCKFVQEWLTNDCMYMFRLHAQARKLTEYQNCLSTVCIIFTQI